jgi:murein DD-endopeptidase MepM/ murein hydrolase activator NlpD
MRRVGLFLIFSLTTVAYGVEQGVLTRGAQKSFLSAQTFPTVFQDLSFVDRMAIKTEGYEPWESEYDDNGRCIKHCVYDGITIEEDIALSKRQTELALKELKLKGYISGAVQPPTLPEQKKIVQSETPVQSNIQQQQNVPTVVSSNEDANVQDINISVTSVDLSGVPFGSPVRGRPIITSKFGMRMHPIKKIMLPHQGVDIRARNKTEIIAPANGIVTNVWNEGRTGCGKGLKIQHDMGFETVYCHLSEWKVSMWQTVVLGQVIALSGNTGGSTGPHLHYGIKHNGVFVNPEEFIGR